MDFSRSIILIFLVICCLSSVLNQQLRSNLTSEPSELEKKLNKELIKKLNEIKVKRIENLESVEKSNLINKNDQERCEKYNYDCAGCLTQKNCVLLLV